MKPALVIRRIKNSKAKGPVSRWYERKALSVHAKLATEVQEMKAGPK